MTIDLRHPLPGSMPLVVGAGRSGLAAAKLLRRHGLDVTVCDARPEKALADAPRLLADAGATLHAGRDDVGLLARHDLVIWSPGIPDSHALAVAARNANIPVMSELELGYLASQAPWICVTGTNGKSTTTDLVGTLLGAGGRAVQVCGNIGRAVCEVAEQVPPTGFMVVEVSSFQLETVDRLRPFVAVWLNLAPDHLDRHGDLERYGRMKQRLFARQEDSDWSVWNADDAEVMRRKTGAAATLTFSTQRAVEAGAYADADTIVLARRGGTERLMPVSALRLRGAHNLANALAALAATLPLDVAPPTLRETLETYGGLEHRLEPVAELEGIAFINDSKATNTASLEVALVSFDQPVVLIAGGRDKQQDFSGLAGLVAARVHEAVLIGEGAERIAAAWPGVPCARAGSMAGAVERAFATARAQGVRVVLLSPGCASFDMFTDYEDRGRRFKTEVRRLLHHGANT